MSQGSYLICPECKSAKVEIVCTGTKTKIDLNVLWNKNRSWTKRVQEQKRHCMNCGYLW